MPFTTAITFKALNIILIQVHATSASHHNLSCRLFLFFNPIYEYGNRQLSIFAFLWEP